MNRRHVESTHFKFLRLANKIGIALKSSYFTVSFLINQNYLSFQSVLHADWFGQTKKWPLGEQIAVDCKTMKKNKQLPAVFMCAVPT